MDGWGADAAGAGNVCAGLSEAARSGRLAVFVHERDLGELGELQDEVADDALLLPGLETRLLHLGGDGVENTDAVGEVELDLLRDSSRHVLVAKEEPLAPGPPPGSRGGARCWRRS